MSTGRTWFRERDFIRGLGLHGEEADDYWSRPHNYDGYGRSFAVPRKSTRVTIPKTCLNCKNGCKGVKVCGLHEKRKA